MTGGTALSEFYYHHRLSEDIDLFCEEKEIDLNAIEAFIKKNMVRLGANDYKISQFFGLVSFLLTYKDSSKLKVDFNYYPFPLIEKGITYKKLRVDSIYDIAANKVHTLFMRARSRDFIDLYFILIKEKYSLKKLILSAKAKFDWDIDKVTLGSQFLRAGEFPEYPTMLAPFNKKAMVEFYKSLATELKKEIFINNQSNLIPSFHAE